MYFMFELLFLTPWFLLFSKYLQLLSRYCLAELKNLTSNQFYEITLTPPGLCSSQSDRIRTPDKGQHIFVSFRFSSFFHY